MAESETGPRIAELARTAVARARVATLVIREVATGKRSFAVVALHDHADGQLSVALDCESPLIRSLRVRPLVTIAVGAPAPFTALQLVGTAIAVPGPGEGLVNYHVTVLGVRFTGAKTVEVNMADYRQSSPDPLWRQAPSILEHLEQSHASDLLACVQAHGIHDAEGVVPRVLDRYGIEVAVMSGSGVSVLRLLFPDAPADSVNTVETGIRAVLTCRCGHSPPQLYGEGSSAD